MASLKKINTHQDFHLKSRFEGIPTQIGIEQAYEYYLNQSYRLHINTPCWFYSFLKFETSEREKIIEIYIDKQGYSIYVSNYYEMKFKRNRFLINSFNFNKNSLFQGGALSASSRAEPGGKSQSYLTKTEKRTQLKGKQAFAQKAKRKDFLTHNSLSEPSVSLPSENLFWNIKFNEITSFHFKSICIAQIMRSTFGRIEFYLHTLHFFGTRPQSLH